MADLFLGYLRKKLKQKKVIKEYILSWLAWLFIQFVGKTSRIKTINYEIVKRIKENGKNVIYSFWHGRQFLLVYTHRLQGITIMTSLSRDGALQTGILSKFGYFCIRGSSSRGWLSATRKIAEKIETGRDAAFAVDGPQGPVYEVKPGAIYLAQLTGSVIVPLSSSARYKKIIPHSWDEYLLPFPFNRVVVIYGNPIEVKKGDRWKDKISQLEKEINSITQEADRLVKLPI